MNVSFHGINYKRGLVSRRCHQDSSGGFSVRQGTLICSRKSSSGLRGCVKIMASFFFSGIPIYSYDILWCQKMFCPIFITTHCIFFCIEMDRKWIGNVMRLVVKQHGTKQLEYLLPPWGILPHGIPSQWKLFISVKLKCHPMPIA
jgi:hypothetical protein